MAHTSGVFHLHIHWSPNCLLRFKHLWNYQFPLGVKLHENLQTFLDTPVSNHTALEDTWSPSFMLLLYIRKVVADSLRPHGLQHASLPCPSLHELAQTRIQWSDDAVQSISSSVACFSSCPQFFPASRVFYSESALSNRCPKYWSFSFNIISSNESSGLISFRGDWLGHLAVQGTLKESSPAPQFESINSLALNLLYCPALTSIGQHWKNQSFDSKDLCWKSDVSAF